MNDPCKGKNEGESCGEGLICDAGSFKPFTRKKFDKNNKPTKRYEDYLKRRQKELICVEWVDDVDLDDDDDDVVSDHTQLQGKNPHSEAIAARNKGGRRKRRTRRRKKRKRKRTKNKRRRRRRTRKRKGGQEELTTVQKIVRGKQLRECKLKLKRMRKARDEFRAESTSNLAIERANVDDVLKQGDQLAKDITQILAITEKHYKKNNRVSQLVKELSDKKLY